MGMILRIASSRIVGQGDIVGRSGYFSLNLSANSVMRGRLDARRTLKSLVADLRYLSKVSNSDLQNLTNATTAIFDDLYSSVGNKSDDVNDRTMLYLTMRFNRRIIQNAMACRNDIINNQRLDRDQRANYKWMLIQPFMAIDDYSTAVLTDEQRETLIKLTDELPALLGKLDVQKKSDNEQIKLTNVLANYFLKSYLSTTL